MSPRVSIGIMVAATVATVAVFLFRINWIYGTSGLIVMAGTGFFAASMYLTNRDDRPQTALAASKLRAIGITMVGLGALFAALMVMI